MLKNLRQVFQSGLEAAQKELAAAIESGDAQLKLSEQKNCNSAFENAKLEQAKAGREEQQVEKPVLISTTVQTSTMDEPINPDPKAEAWAAKTHGLVLIKQ